MSFLSALSVRPGWFQWLKQQAVSHPVLPVLLLCVLAIVSGVMLSQWIPVPMAWAAGLAFFCLIFWATGFVPEYWPVLVFFLVAMVFHVAPAQTVFSGFSSSVFWLFFSGMILGASIRFTGLDKRIAVFISRLTGHKYTTLISMTVMCSFLLSFIIPSAMGRVVLLLPMVTGLADHMGYTHGRPGRQGFLLAAFFGTILPGFTILPANAPNMVLAGTTENVYGYHFSYWEYLSANLPVLGVLKLVLLVLVILRMFPDQDPETAPEQQSRTPALSSGEKKLIAIIAACLLGWLTDSLHHVSPGWIALAAAVICLLPGTGLTAPKCLTEEVNYGSLFFIAGVLGLGGVISASGLGHALVETLSDHIHFSEGQDLFNLGALTGISTLIAFAVSLPGVPIVMTPVAQGFASVTGLPLAAVLMTQVMAFSNVFLPYQSPPMLTSVKMAKVSLGAASRLSVTLFILTVFILIPLNLLWWKTIGMIG